MTVCLASKDRATDASKTPLCTERRAEDANMLLANPKQGASYRRGLTALRGYMHSNAYYTDIFEVVGGGMCVE